MRIVGARMRSASGVPLLAGAIVVILARLCVAWAGDAATSPQTRPQSQPAADPQNRSATEAPADSPYGRPVVETVRGSVMRQLIPPDMVSAIDDPRFVKASEATLMRDDERVLGLEITDPPRAYPLRQLERNEIVNDAVGDLPVAATW